jgi:hypothetical protein
MENGLARKVAWLGFWKPWPRVSGV